MPPSYRPLPVEPPTGLTLDAFRRQGSTIADYEKDLAIRRATELANQQNEIRTAEAQRVADEEKVYREALAQHYGNSNIGDIDPTVGLQLAQKLALQGGNIDRALAIERATKSRAGSIPLSPEQLRFASDLMGRELPPGSTQDDVDRYNALSRTNIYNSSVQETQDKRQDELAALAPGGYQSGILDEATGIMQMPRKEDGKKFTTAVVAHEKIDSYLNQLTSSLSAAGSNDPTSPEFVRQRQLISAIQVAFKEKANFGAALTQNEEFIMNGQLPRLLARSDVGLGTALVELGLGRDPLDAITNLKQILKEELEVQRRAYKFSKIPSNTNQQQDLSGALNRSGTPPPNTAITPEEQAYKQQKVQEALARLQAGGR